MDLAFVVNTTDKYHNIWDGWYHYFKKYWDHDIPTYWLNETRNIDYPFKQIKVDIPDVRLWTKKLRESVKLIPESNLLITLEDLFFTDSLPELEVIYDFFRYSRADAVQIRPQSKAIITHRTLYKRFSRFDSSSNYLIAHQPCLWRKDFLLECLSVDESPWESEVNGTKRLGACKVYHYEKDWFVNILRHGKINPKHLKYLQYG